MSSTPLPLFRRIKTYWDLSWPIEHPKWSGQSFSARWDENRSSMRKFWAKKGLMGGRLTLVSSRILWKWSCLQILVVKKEFEITFETVFEIARAKLWKSAGEKLLGNWTGFKMFRGRFEVFFKFFISLFVFAFHFGIKHFSGNFVLQKCHPENRLKVVRFSVLFRTLGACYRPLTCQTCLPPVRVTRP